MQETITPKRTSTFEIEDDVTSFIQKLREYAIRGLYRMFMDKDDRFIFSMRQTPRGVRKVGVSSRYTAISLIGLATLENETAMAILSGRENKALCRSLAREVIQGENLGDVALALWAAQNNGCEDRKDLVNKLSGLVPDKRAYPTVELSWALDALIGEKESRPKAIVHAIAERLITAQNVVSGAFPHNIGTKKGIRHHICCFADAVYPIHALSNYFMAYEDRRALDAAQKCADLICKTQGPEGQWWWHYDVRTGKVVEGYPVYSVHQDAMAPMALLKLQQAGGTGHRPSIRKGLDWLAWSPEIGTTLMDEEADLIWRKVARKEPKKAVRYLQTLSSRIHPTLRIPGVDFIFPAAAIDYENRPYHLGWILYAWSPQHLAIWDLMEK